MLRWTKPSFTAQSFAAASRKVTPNQLTEAAVRARDLVEEELAYGEARELGCDYLMQLAQRKSEERGVPLKVCPLHSVFVVHGLAWMEHWIPDVPDWLRDQLE